MRLTSIVGLLSVVLVLGGSAAVYAAEEHRHGHEASDAQTLTGEVVDLVCYAGHPDSGIGPGHAECAQKCIKNGLPVAIRSAEGALYVALGAGHETVNALLAPYAGKHVTVHGAVLERDGLKMVQVRSVEPAQ